MKIKRLEIENFRNHQHSVMEIDASFVVIRGGNFAGKSSVGQAISMGLTPSTTALDDQGRGFISKIKRGATKSVITLDVKGGTHVVRQEVTLNTNTSGRTPKSTCLDDPDWKPLPFDNLLKAKKDALMVCLNTDRFLLGLNEEGQKNLLAKLALPSRYDFAQETIAGVEKAIGQGAINFEDEPFAVIAKTYKKLYDERQIVNRQVKEFSVPDSLGVTGWGLDSASLQAKLNEARDVRQRILTEKDAAVSKASDGEVERVRVQTKLDSIQEKVKEVQAMLVKAEANLLSDVKLKEISKVAAGKEVSNELSKDRSVIAATITALKSETDRLNGLLGKFSEAGAKCPTCDQEVDIRVINALLAAAQRELAEAQEKDNSILRDMKVLGDVDGAAATLARHEAAKEEQKAIRAVIADKEKTLKMGKDKLASMGAKVDVGAEFAEALTNADEEINAITEQLRPVIAAEERTKEIAIKTEQLNKLQAKAAAVDSLVKYFDKDGIKATLLSEHIGGFESKLNEVLNAWGYSTSLSIEPYEFLCTDTRGVTTPVRELSGSEQLMFSVALQCAVSRAAGIGIVVADRMDTFLPLQRSKANRALYTATQDGTLEQVIVIVSDETEEIPVLPNAMFFKVEDGLVRQLGK